MSTNEDQDQPESTPQRVEPQQYFEQVSREQCTMELCPDGHGQNCWQVYRADGTIAYEHATFGLAYRLVYGVWPTI